MTSAKKSKTIRRFLKAAFTYVKYRKKFIQWDEIWRFTLRRVLPIGVNAVASSVAAVLVPVIMLSILQVHVIGNWWLIAAQLIAEVVLIGNASWSLHGSWQLWQHAKTGRFDKGYPKNFKSDAW